MEPFASVDDLEARWRELDDGERRQASAVLDDVTAHIAARLERSGIVLGQASTLYKANLKAVACAAARRAMLAAEDRAGIRSAQQQAGPYMETFSFDNPSGDVYLTSSERKTLGLDRLRVVSIDVFGGRQP